MHAFRSKLTLLCSMLLAPFASAAVSDASLHLPLTFEQNDGQVATPYRFTTRHGGVPASFRQDGVDFAVTDSSGSRHLLRMDFPGAERTVHLAGKQPLPGVSNYVKGNDPAAWHTQVPTYGEVLFQELFPGVDLVFHGDTQERELEHDFVLHPGSDPDVVRFALQGADSAALDRKGELVVTVGDRRIVFHAPNAWQESPKGRQAVAAHFAQLSPGVFGFHLGSYNRSAELTIDPVLAFATYLDGSSSDTINAITTDTAGNIYLAGETFSTDFPVAAPEQQANHGTQDAFISKLDPSGHTLLYSTYLGGSNVDSAQSIAVDSSGAIVVSGISNSRDFPAAGKLSSTIQTYTSTYNFITSFAADGQTLRYSGFLGSTAGNSDGSNSRLNRVVFDSKGAAYLAGLVQDGYPYTQGAYGGPPAEYPAAETLFVAKVLADGSLAYGATIPEIPQQVTVTTEPRIDLGGLAVDAEGEVVLAGKAAQNLPTTDGVLAPSLPADAGVAGYVLKLNASGSALIFSTHLPGTDSVFGLALNSAEEIFLAGTTSKTDLPTLPNAFQGTLASKCNCSAGFVYKLSNDGKAALAATYYGNPTSPTQGYAYNATQLREINLDANGNVVVGGGTTGGVPLKNPLTGEASNISVGLANNILIALRFSPDLSTLQFGTYLNAPAQDAAGNDYVANLAALTVNAQNQLLVAGTTFSTLFPTTPGAFQSTPPSNAGNSAGITHQFLAAIDPAVPAGAACYATTFVYLPNQFVGTTGNTPIAVTNCGNDSLTLPALTSSDPSVAATHNCTAVAPGDSCQIQLAFTPTSTMGVYGVVTVPGSATLWPQQITFRGTGGYPEVSVQSSLGAPDALLGQTTQAYLVLYNTGTAPFVLQSATVTGDFQVDSSNCTAALAPNAPCTITIFFTPGATGTRTGTLTLTDNLTPSTQTVQLTGQALTTAPVPTVTSVPLVLQPAAGDGSVTVFGTYFLPNSIVNWNGQPLVTVYQGEQRLAATVPASLLQVGEATVTVSTPAPGGGTSNSAVATVYGQLNVQVLHEVYSPVTGLLYATTSPDSPIAPNSVVAVDPERMQVTATLLTGNAPDQLAVSDDGSLLYVGLDTPGAVAQIALPSGQVNFTTTLPVGQDFDAGSKSTASALAVLPGKAHSWLVALCSPNHSPCGEGVALFDDAVQRPEIASQSLFTANSFAFLSDPTSVYALDTSVVPEGVLHFTISATGLTLAASYGNLDALYPGPLLSDGQQLFVDDGEVIDPATLATVFTYPVRGQAFTLDVPNNRLFYITDDNYFSYFLTEVDKTTQAIGGRLQIPTTYGVRDLQRFGTQGLVLNAYPTDSTFNLFFLKSSLISTAAPPAQLSLSPAALTFAGQPPNTTSAPQTLTVTNVSTSPIAIPGLSINGDFAQTNTCIGTLPSGGTCTVSVTFSPSVVGSASGHLTLGNSGNPSSLAVPLTGTGLPAATYTATLTPASLSFASQLLGTSSAGQTVTLTNTGTGTLTLSGLNLIGDFQQTSTCGATLVAGAACNLVVTFTPTAAGIRSGTLTLTEKESSNPQSVALSGTGMAPLTYTASTSPGALIFATQDVGSSSTPQPVTLRNTGTASLTVSGVTVSGDFSQSNTCGATLAMGASCMVNVTFTPTASGTRTGTLTLNDDASAGPQTVALTGNADSALTLTPGAPGGSSVTVTSGATASYALALTPGVYSGPVALSCSGAPANASCTLMPTALTVTSGQSQPLNVLVTTQATSQTASALFETRRSHFAAVGLFGLLGLPFFFRRRPGRGTFRALGLIVLACGTALFTGCGGGSSPASSNPASRQVAPGTYTLTVTATASNFSATQSLTLVVK